MVQVGECMFNPEDMCGLEEAKSVSHLVSDSLDSCPIDTKTALASSVVLSGGTSMMKVNSLD